MAVSFRHFSSPKMPKEKLLSDPLVKNTSKGQFGNQYKVSTDWQRIREDRISRAEHNLKDAENTRDIGTTLFR
jgi:hypothetical protein